MKRFSIWVFEAGGSICLEIDNQTNRWHKRPKYGVKSQESVFAGRWAMFWSITWSINVSWRCKKTDWSLQSFLCEDEDHHSACMSGVCVCVCVRHCSVCVCVYVCVCVCWFKCTARLPHTHCLSCDSVDPLCRFFLVFIYLFIYFNLSGPLIRNRAQVPLIHTNQNIKTWTLQL